MSKERAKRRAAREHEAALRQAARAAEQERRERRAARTARMRGAVGVVRPSSGRPTGVLARKRRKQDGLLVAALLVLVVLVWVVRPDWPARLGVLVLVVLAFPVARLLLFSRR